MKKQEGAVLVIALIFLLLITAIAASLMTSGSFETKIVTNKQKQEDVFHTAEAGLEQLFSDQTVFDAADNAKATVDVSNKLAPLPANSGKAYSVEVEPLSLTSVQGGTVPPPGQSFGIGGGTNNKYEMRSTANTLADLPEDQVATQVVLGVIRFSARGFGDQADTGPL